MHDLRGHGESDDDHRGGYGRASRHSCIWRIKRSRLPLNSQLKTAGIFADVTVPTIMIKRMHACMYVRDRLLQRQCMPYSLLAASADVSLGLYLRYVRNYSRLRDTYDGRC